MMLPRTCVALILLLGLAVPLAAQNRSDAPVRLYVGPLVKNGIVETDSGVEDTIKDVKRRLRWQKKDLVAVDNQSESQLALIILRRGAGRDRGAVAAPIGAGAIALPIEGRVIDATLKVGDYQRPLRCEDENWSDCAANLLNDVRAWIKANRAALK